ncbi:uncharacterized protein V6R79_006323 [Siganus canaliculatus]
MSGELLDHVPQTEVRVQGADQIKEEDPPDQKDWDWNSGLDQDQDQDQDQKPELPLVKEEEEEQPIGGDAVAVKSEEDDEEKPRLLRPDQLKTESPPNPRPGGQSSGAESDDSWDWVDTRTPKPRERREDAPSGGGGEKTGGQPVSPCPQTVQDSYYRSLLRPDPSWTLTLDQGHCQTTCIQPVLYEAACFMSSNKTVTVWTCHTPDPDQQLVRKLLLSQVCWTSCEPGPASVWALQDQCLSPDLRAGIETVDQDLESPHVGF